MSITVRITSNYGTRTIYPVCETAKLLAELAGTKTITTQALDIIKRMGYAINVQQEQL